jgi:cystathionine beta-lyase/cystathionine gamma-synthase
LRRFGVSPRNVRLHVGLEDPEELWADLARALDRAAARSSETNPREEERR